MSRMVGVLVLLLWWSALACSQGTPTIVQWISIFEQVRQHPLFSDLTMTYEKHRRQILASHRWVLWRGQGLTVWLLCQTAKTQNGAHDGVSYQSRNNVCLYADRGSP